MKFCVYTRVSLTHGDGAAAESKWKAFALRLQRVAMSILQPPGVYMNPFYLQVIGSMKCRCPASWKMKNEGKGLSGAHILEFGAFWIIFSVSPWSSVTQLSYHQFSPVNIGRSRRCPISSLDPACSERSLFFVFCFLVFVFWFLLVAGKEPQPQWISNKRFVDCLPWYHIAIHFLCGFRQKRFNDEIIQILSQRVQSDHDA